MSKNPEIEQSWWHIEDQLKPSKCRIFRQVMDLYINKNYFGIDLPLHDGNISGLQIIGRNKSEELSFIVKNHKLYVNLGEIKSWPPEMEINGKKSKNALRRHVKIEIKYMEEYKEPGTGFEFNGLAFWKAYTGYLSIELPVRPEFMVTVPLGMEIGNSGKKLELTLFRFGKDNNTDESCVKESNNDETDDNFEEIPLEVEDPIINKKDGKKVYTYSISHDSQDLISETPEDCEMILQATYYVKNERNFWGITVFAGILIFFTIVEVLRVLTGTPGQIGTPELSMLIALFSFTAFVLTLHKDNYEIPCNRFVTGSIIFTIGGMLSILIIYLHGLN